MQHLLADACWDAAAARDDLRGYVVEHLGDPGGLATRAVEHDPVHVLPPSGQGSCSPTGIIIPPR